MDSFVIRGGNRLSGQVEISGSKNASLPLLAAALMGEGKTTFNHVPRLSDIDSMLKLLADLGCEVRRHEPTASGNKLAPPLNGPLDVTVTDESNCEAGYEIVKTMRASICVLGPLLAKRKKAIVSLPGGCAIGDRPIDLHLRGLAKLGAEFSFEGGNVIGTVKGRLKGARMYLGGTSGPTVLGTINVMSAAALAEGTTTIVGAACEPEVTDVGDYLNSMGANIRGHGSPEIVIEGVDRLTGTPHNVIPDRIEAGTFVLAAAMTGGELSLANCKLKHLIALVDLLESVGVQVAEVDGKVRARRAGGADGPLAGVETTTQPYPGFPTDLQAQLMALLCLSNGASIITERIYPDRFLHVAELNRLGARIRKEGPTAMIIGVDHLQGATVMCSDLRASAALVMAGLAAHGTTRLDRVYHIDRGYEKIEHKLTAVGAEIERVRSN